MTTSEPGAKIFTLTIREISPTQGENFLWLFSMPKIREWTGHLSQIHRYHMGPCLVFEVQENAESYLGISWKILCKFVWNCLLAGGFTLTLTVSDFSIPFFNNVFIPGATNFKVFYSRAVRLHTSWNNRKTFPGHQASPASPPPAKGSTGVILILPGCILISAKRSFQVESKHTPKIK